MQHLAITSANRHDFMWFHHFSRLLPSPCNYLLVLSGIVAATLLDIFFLKEFLSIPELRSPRHKILRKLSVRVVSRNAFRKQAAQLKALLHSVTHDPRHFRNHLLRLPKGTSARNSTAAQMTHRCNAATGCAVGRTALRSRPYNRLQRWYTQLTAHLADQSR